MWKRKTKKKILVIDDEENFTKLVKLNLEGTGNYKVEAETQGSCGLAVAKKFKPDLILLDLLMPDMDGGKVAQQIKGDEDVKNIPIVFLTALATEKETSSCGGMIGGHSFISKSMSVEELISCIEETIG